MNKKLLLSFPILLSLGGAYVYLNHSTKIHSDSIATVSPTNTTATQAVGKKSILANTVSNIFHNSVNVYDITISAVVYMGDAKEDIKTKTESYIDITVNAKLHAGLVNNSESPLVVAKLVDVKATSANGALDEKTFSITQQLLSETFGFEYNSEGRVTKIHLAPKEDDFSSSIKRTIASRMQFSLNGTDQKMDREEENESGRYTTSYTTKDFLSFNKTINAYIEPAKINGQPANYKIDILDQLENYTLDNVRQLKHISSISTIATRGNPINVKANAEFILDWSSQSSQVINAAMIQGFNVSALHHRQGANAEPDNKIAKEDQINTAKFMSLITGLDLNNDHSAIWDHRARLVASIMSNPENLNGFLDLFKNTKNESQKSLLLGILKDAGTPEAQATLVSLIENESIDIATRQHALTFMTFLENPSPASVDYLINAANRTGGNAEMKITAIMALGGAIKAGMGNAGQLDSSQLNQYQSALSQLEQGFMGSKDSEERKAYLMGLGNAGQESTKAMLAQLTQSEDPSLRALSVDSMRFQKGPDVDNRVISMMTSDKDIGVQVTAARSTVYRDENPQLDSALLQTAKSAASEDVRIAALGSLDFRNSNNAEFINELQSISHSDGSEKVRQFADELYKARLDDNEQMASTQTTGKGNQTTSNTDVNAEPKALDFAQLMGKEIPNELPPVK